MSYNEQIENYLGSSGEVAYKGKLIWNLFHINSYRIFAINTIFSIASICIKDSFFIHSFFIYSSEKAFHIKDV